MCYQLISTERERAILNVNICRLYGMKMKTLLFLALMILPVWCLINSQGASNIVVQHMKNQVMQLEQNLENLQTQSKVQEQNHASLIHLTLSKLATATDELTAVQQKLTTNTEELTIVKQTLTATTKELSTVKQTLALRTRELNVLASDHNATLTELATMKADMKNMEKTFADLLLSTANNFTSTESEIRQLKSEFSTSKLNLSYLTNDIRNLTLDLSSVQSEVSGLKQDAASTSRTLASVQSSLNTTTNKTRLQFQALTITLQNISSGQTGLNLEISDMKQNLSLRQNYTDNSLALLRQSIDILATSVAFQVNQPTSFILHNSHTLTPTDLNLYNVTMNVGHGYDHANGRFTAPITGIYMFWANVHLYNPYSISLALTKEGYQVTSIEASNGVDLTLTHAMLVQKGEQIWCQVTSYQSRMQISTGSYYGGMLVHVTD